MNFEMNLGAEQAKDNQEAVMSNELLTSLTEEVMSKLDLALNQVGGGIDNLNQLLAKTYDDQEDALKIEEIKALLGELSAGGEESVIDQIVLAYEEF